MKETLITLSLAVMTSSVFASACPKPNQYAEGAFKLIETSSGRKLQKYLEDFVVAKTARNEECLDMYMVALRTRNEGARNVLDKIGYGPRNKEEVNMGRPWASYYQFALMHSPLSVIRSLQSLGGRTSFTARYAATSNTTDVIDWALSEDRAEVDSIFQQAVAENKKNVIEYLIRKGANPSAKGVLSAAIERNDPSIIQLLVRSGAEVTKDDLDKASSHSSVAMFQFLFDSQGERLKETTLEHASMYGRIDMVQYLISRGLPIGHRTERGASLLMLAALSGNTSLVKFYQSQGLDPFATDRFKNTLFAYSNSEAMINYVKSLGLDVNKSNQYGETPLYYAVVNNKTATAKSLLRAGANPNINNIPLVISQSCSDLSEFLEELLKSKVDINVKDSKGFTPLHWAVFRTCNTAPEKIIKILIKNGADRTATVKIDGQELTAYDLYLRNNHSSSWEIAGLLKP